MMLNYISIRSYLYLIHIHNTMRGRTACIGVWKIELRNSTCRSYIFTDAILINFLSMDAILINSLRVIALNDFVI